MDCAARLLLRGQSPDPPVPNLIPVVRAANAGRECANIRLLQEHHPRPIAVRLERPREHELFDTIRMVRAIAADSGVGTPDGPKDYTPHLQTRADSQLWRVVAEAVGATAGLEVRYGDYGIVPPIPKPGGTPRSPNPFVRYTTAGQTLCLARRVPRDRPPDGARAEIFTEVADMLTERPEFAGSDYSWGDREFVQCTSTGTRRTGRSTDWIAMATSHHLTHLARPTRGPGETSPA